MKSRSQIIIAFFIFLSLVSLDLRADNTKKAQKFLAKKEYSKALELLKEDVHKDKANVNANLILSQLFLTEDFQQYSPDSSFHYIVESIVYFDSISDEKALSRLNKIGVNENSLITQRKHVEKAAYDIALNLNTVSGYQHFINTYINSEQLKKAIALRNELAFKEAEEKNTFVAFYNFMRNYPEAVQVPKAQAKYDKLLYETKTKNGSLKSLKSFRSANPNSPYLRETETRIFKLQCASNDLDSTYDFLLEYGFDSPISREVASYMLAQYRTLEDTVSIFERFPKLPYKDSIENVMNLDRIGYVTPMFDQDISKYYFIKPNGKKLFDKEFDEIPQNYVCGDIKTSFLMGQNDDRGILLGRNGKEIYQGDFTEAKDLGYGLIGLINSESSFVVHECGWEICPSGKFDQVKLLNQSFILTQKSDDVGLYSATGIEILRANYDDIEYDNGFLIIDNGDRLAIVHEDEILSRIGEPLLLSFKYDDYEVVSNDYVIGIVDGDEVLLNKNDEQVISIGKQRIYGYSNYWIVNNDSGSEIYDKQGEKISHKSFEQILFNENWLSFQFNKKWALQLRDSLDLNTLDFKYDSVNLVSDEFVFAIENQNANVFFSDSKEVLTVEAQKLLLRVLTNNLTGDDRKDFLEVKDKTRIVRIFGEQGEEFLKGYFKNVIVSPSGYLIIEAKNKKGLKSPEGKSLLKTVYNGITESKKGFFDLFLNSKFGLYSMEKDMYIKPTYSRTLEVYNDTLLVGNLWNKSGFINYQNKRVSKFEFGEIQHWNDSIALVKKENTWQLYDIYEKKLFGEKFNEFEVLIENEKEKVLIIRQNGQEGVLSSIKGLVIEPTLDQIVNIGDDQQPLYMGDKYVYEAELHILVYYDKSGERIKRLSLSNKEFKRLFCNKE
ncbi:WG repeat-containing protein [Aureibacter tunicatorum]|uniref:WG repeat-containing protein n=1 Tax=Aureibacter tunicatorum TaxID=866807 RepID=A0AAE3XNZ9_9BACT|nr:WG repeat-containing protein [Aureibacter tunicatorum]MDR6239399.1 hypothetical protein [Aureibacter tunicatorum]BDD04678.1 hypothetical protein AUTU_21610 [Aureibacter tunicatorum]